MAASSMPGSITSEVKRALPLVRAAPLTRGVASPISGGAAVVFGRDVVVDDGPANLGAALDDRLGALQPGH